MRKTPMQGKALKTSLPNISRALTQLENKGFITCLTPREKLVKSILLQTKVKKPSRKSLRWN